MKKLFGRSKGKESKESKEAVASGSQQPYLPPPGQQPQGFSSSPSPNPTTNPPFPPPWNSFPSTNQFPGFQGPPSFNPYQLYQQPAPYPPQGQYYSPSPPPAQLFTSPSPNPMPFTPEQLAMFTPEQRAQIVQWSGQAQSTPPSQSLAGPSSSSVAESAASIPLAPQVAVPAPPPVSEKQTLSSSSSQSSASTSAITTAPPAPPANPDKHKEDSAALLKEQANSMLKNGDNEGAITYYTLALDYTPKSAIILANRSIAYFSLSPPKLNEAITDARKAIEFDPTYWKAWSRLGQYLVEKGPSFAEEAKGALEKAIRLGGQDVTAATRNALERANQILERNRMPDISHLSLNQTPSSRLQTTTPAQSTMAPTRTPTVQAPPPPPDTSINLARRQSQSVGSRTYASPTNSSLPASLSPTTSTRTYDVPTGGGTEPGLPSYTPNFSSDDPAIRALSAQALVEQVNAMTDHLRVKNKGAVQIQTLTTSGNIKALQVVYSYMVASELTARETGNVQPAHPSFASLWIDRVTIPGNTFLDMDMESSKLYAGKTPGTVGLSGYSEEYRASKLPERLNLMLCNYDPLPILSTDSIISHVTLILLGLPQSVDTAEKEIRELLPPLRRATTSLPTWQSQIADLCYALNRNEPSTFVDFSVTRNISNNTLGGTGQGIGLTKFLYQILLGAQLLRRLWKEPINIDYTGLVTDPISALLVIVNQWMQNVDIVKSTNPPTATGLPRYLLVSRVHQRQAAGLIRFAELLQWPYISEARSFIENAYSTLIAGTLANFDVMDWLFGLIQPGKVFRHRIMSSLVACCTSTKSFGGAPYYDSGLILPGRSYWPQRTVLGRVLGGLTNPKWTCGWVGPVPKPTKEGLLGWVVVTARQVEFPEPCTVPPGEEDDWLEVLINGSGDSTEDVIRELTNVSQWVSPTFPERAHDMNDTVTFKGIDLEELPIVQSTNEQQYRATLVFTINGSPVSYTLYTNPVFTSAHPCVGGNHVMHRRDIEKYTKNVFRVSQLKDAFVPENELVVIDASRGSEEVVARAWCSERGRHALVRRGPGCCFCCALYMASGRRGLGVNVLIWGASS